MTMLMPTRNNRFFNNLMLDPFDAFFDTTPMQKSTPALMRTDIRETDAGYEMTIDLPGFNKDDVKAELPVEIKRAKDLVANRNDYIASAKREADDLRDQAEDYAKHLINENAIVREAEKKADQILAETEEQCRLLKAAASEYCEDTLRRMEEAVADAYDEVKHSRAKFRSALGALAGNPPPRSQPSSRRSMYDAEADEDDE